MLKIREAIDLIFSHNEAVALWADEDKEHFCIVWEGMAWDMPEKYLDIDNWRIFGLIPESIDVADTINIHIKDGGDSE